MKIKCKILVIAGSAGSLEVILSLLPQLKQAPPFPIVIVVHRGNSSDSTLAQLLNFKTTLQVREIEDQEPIVPGNIYLAPADYHLLFENDSLFSLDDSEKINYSRPSIDVTLEAAADIFKEGTVAILLSGANEDGAQGLARVKKAGGITVVQKPDTALVAIMPQAAIDKKAVTYILSPQDLLKFILQLTA